MRWQSKKKMPVGVASSSTNNAQIKTQTESVQLILTNPIYHKQLKLVQGPIMYR